MSHTRKRFCLSNTKESVFARTRWHRLLGKLLKELLAPLNISVETDVRVVSDPKADIILIRREGVGWSDKQKVRLADGLRDTSATHLLLEFKYTESLK